MIFAQPPPSWHESVTFIIAVIGAGLGLYNAWMARRSRSASVRQEAPHFVYPEILILFPPPADGKSAPNASFNYPVKRDTVPEEYPEGGAVLFRMTNKGGDARLAEVHVNRLPPGAKGEYWALNDRSTLHVFYRYSRERRGRVETFRITYETVSGHRGEQTFEIQHGFAEAKRVRIS